MRHCPLILLPLCSLSFCIPNPCAAASRQEIVRLENAFLALDLDAKTSGVSRIENKLTGESFRVEEPGFLIELGAGAEAGTLGTLTPASCALESAKSGKSSATWIFAKGPAKATVTYSLDAEDAFAVKRVRVDFTGEGQFNIHRFDMFDWAMQPKPAKAIPYYGFLRPSVLQKDESGEDFPPSDTSTAFFFRAGEGGVFSALSTDFVFMKDDADSGRFRSTYWPGRILDAGQPFESEAGIVGVYRRKGLFHAPYQPTAELRSFHSPDIDTRLDYGEIEGICAAVQKFIKPGVYFTLVNGWGVGLPRIIEAQDHADIFKHAIDTLAKMPALEGLHFIHGWCGLAREFRKQGLAMEVKPNPFADEVFRYAGEKGMKLSPFIGISNNMPANEDGIALEGSPELLSMDANGERRKGNIAISRQYVDFAYNTIVKLNEIYPWIKGQTYDFLSIQPDYDTSHGYLPGRAAVRQSARAEPAAARALAAPDAARPGWLDVVWPLAGRDDVAGTQFGRPRMLESAQLPRFPRRLSIRQQHPRQQLVHQQLQDASAP